MDLNEALANIILEVDNAFGSDNCCRLRMGAFFEPETATHNTKIIGMSSKLRKVVYTCGIIRIRNTVGYKLPFQRVPHAVHLDLYMYPHEGRVYYTIMLLRADSPLDQLPEVREALRAQLGVNLWT